MTTLYTKVGRRYLPCAEHEVWNSFPEGAHLVVCSPGSTLRRFNIDPDRAGLLAAAEPLRAEIRTLVMEMHRMRPTRRPVTQAQADAWHAFERAMGNDAYCVEYASVGEIADAVVDLIVKGKQEWTANAALLAAAPDLLDALRLIATAQERGFGIDYAKGCALAAIRRATGEQP